MNPYTLASQPAMGEAVSYTDSNDVPQTGVVVGFIEGTGHGRSQVPVAALVQPWVGNVPQPRTVTCGWE